MKSAGRTPIAGGARSRDGIPSAGVYGPAHFIEDRPEEILELVEHAAFGHLVVAGPDGLAATPLPWLFDRPADGSAVVASARGHLARANALWHAAPCPALVIVPVTDAYVSPSWYAAKREHGRVVPTWNYEVVHLHGRFVAHDDTAWTETIVRDLTARHEQHRAAPWSVDDPPPGFVAKQLRAIVGVEVVVERVEAKRKLSQNRNDADRVGALTGLEAEGQSRSTAVAASMRGALP